MTKYLKIGQQEIVIFILISAIWGNDTQKVHFPILVLLAQFLILQSCDKKSNQQKRKNYNLLRDRN